MSSGAAMIAHSEKWLRYSVSVMPPLPTSSMSGSFHAPGLACSASGAFCLNSESMLDQLSLMSPVVRQQVTDLVGPLPRLARPPLADAVDDVATRCLERVPHRGVALDVLLLGRAALVEAVVVLEVVDAPVGEGLRVDLLVAEAARVAGARHGARVLVDPELESQRVHVVGGAVDAARELHRVGHQATGLRVALMGHPAVVDVDVLVARVLQARGDEEVRGLLDELLGDVAAERVPVVEPHRWRPGQAVVQRARRRGAARREDEGGQGQREGDDQAPRRRTGRGAGGERAGEWACGDPSTRGGARASGG